MKKYVIGLITGILICGVGVYAATQYKAEEISYKNTTVKAALDDLYSKKDAFTVCRFVDGKYGNKGTVGAKYECTLGDKDENNNYIKRNFYILKVNSNNLVELIMERNITDYDDNKDLVWDDAMNYFINGNGVKYTNAWKNVVDVGLPSVDDIASAVNRSFSWDSFNGWWCLDSGAKDLSNTPYCNINAEYNWLYNYLKECTGWCDLETNLENDSVVAYWTKTEASTLNAMDVYKTGGFFMDPKSTTNYAGVRPVITVLKSQLN